MLPCHRYLQKLMRLPGLLALLIGLIFLAANAPPANADDQALLEDVKKYQAAIKRNPNDANAHAGGNLPHPTGAAELLGATA